MSAISFEITPLLLTERYREWEKPNFCTDFSQGSSKIHEKSKTHVVQVSNVQVKCVLAILMSS